MYRYIKMIHSYDFRLTSESFSVFRRPIFRSSRWVWACNSAILFCRCRSFSSEDLRFYKQKHQQFNKSEQSYKLGHHLITEKTSSYKYTATWIFPPQLNISVFLHISKRTLKSTLQTAIIALTYQVHHSCTSQTSQLRLYSFKLINRENLNTTPPLYVLRYLGYIYT